MKRLQYENDSSLNENVHVKCGPLVGDFIAENEQHWILYIPLRNIFCICLQTRVRSHTPTPLENLIENHHRLYLQLHGQSLKLKHHNILHYSRFMREVGLLRHIWSMRYEAKHRLLKKSSAVSYNRINI